jgi:hypothetical protein
MPQQPPDRPLDDLEAALKTLRPTTQLQRDQLMYLAGQASAGRRPWIWPASTTAFAALAVALTCVLVFRPEPVPEVRVVYVPVNPKSVPFVPQKSNPPLPGVAAVEKDVASTRATHDSPGLWQLEQQALHLGVESLPLPAPSVYADGQPLTLDSLLDQLDKNSFGKY